jgi:hypothetical protein
MPVPVAPIRRRSAATAAPCPQKTARHILKTVARLGARALVCGHVTDADRYSCATRKARGCASLRSSCTDANPGADVVPDVDRLSLGCHSRDIGSHTEFDAERASFRLERRCRMRAQVGKRSAVNSATGSGSASTDRAWALWIDPSGSLVFVLGGLRRKLDGLVPVSAWDLRGAGRRSG